MSIDESAETNDYDLPNDDKPIITVSKINGQWKAVRISDR